MGQYVLATHSRGSYSGRMRNLLSEALKNEGYTFGLISFEFVSPSLFYIHVSTSIDAYKKVVTDIARIVSDLGIPCVEDDNTVKMNMEDKGKDASGLLKPMFEKALKVLDPTVSVEAGKYERDYVVTVVYPKPTPEDMKFTDDLIEETNMQKTIKSLCSKANLFIDAFYMDDYPVDVGDGFMSYNIDITIIPLVSI